MIRSPFWVNDAYSLGYWLKDYGYYPKDWPLFSYMDHGMTLFDTIPPHETENDAPLIFKFSQRLVDAYRKISTKPVYPLLNPTIHCRREKKISANANAQGTLFFPGHSTDMINDHTDWDLFIESLEKIPANFKPIDICLHPTDVNKGLDKIFTSKGYNVYSAGDVFGIDFAERLYGILGNYKYSMSNLMGSYTFYAVEMGIPFSLYGTEPQYINTGDPNVEQGAYTNYREIPTYQKALALFQGFHTSINAEQNEFVNNELGKYHTVSRIRASYLLYRSLLQYLARHPGYAKTLLLSFLRKIKNKIRYPRRLETITI